MNEDFKEKFPQLAEKLERAKNTPTDKERLEALEEVCIALLLNNNE